MNKQKLIEAACARLEKDLAALSAAAEAAYEGAVGDESKPENEYDTRALEASYIATAQSKRAAEIAELIGAYRRAVPRTFGPDDPIDATALVELEHGRKRSTVFLMPKGSGLTVEVEGRAVQIIGPGAPLGEALMGLKEGDEAFVETGRGTQTYEILSVT